MLGFVPPPAHVNFLARKLFGEEGEIIDVSIAYLQSEGGGPIGNHVHPQHDHLFVVTKGQARIPLGEEAIILGKDEVYRVSGSIPHSVWNHIEGETVMIGISVKNK